MFEAWCSCINLKGGENIRAGMLLRRNLQPIFISEFHGTILEIRGINGNPGTITSFVNTETDEIH